MRLSEVITTSRRFSRSANVERDHGKSAIEGYLPTGRAVDVVARIGRGLGDASSGRAFSITGPHGGGKSSLAVFLGALLAGSGTADHLAAMRLLEESDPAVAQVVAGGLKSIDPEGRGAIRAFATADRESVAVTVARALHSAAVREHGRGQRVVPSSFADPDGAKELTSRDILAAVRKLTETQPLVILVDEFGKNLEAYAAGGREGDPYLLQELAEAAQGENPLPLILITMQHLSFDEYVQEASVARRREWAKVQGRFQDIPYVETAAQSRRLICATISRAESPLSAAWARWLRDHEAIFKDLGLRDLAQAAPLAYPLHPLALAVLPDLCSRYGQNERTLFSFLAGSEPLAVPAFLEATSWVRGKPLPFVGLDRIYDYFLDSATTSIGTSATASRWLEIESRIRDTAGLSAAQSRALKAIGVLNLVSSAGSLRASKDLVTLSLQGSSAELQSAEAVDEVLERLEGLGLVTYREFADEFRIWNGSDFDLRGAVELARRAARSASLANLLNETVSLDPAIAGRHSQEWGVLRVFDRKFSDLSDDDLVAPDIDSEWDGHVLYAVDSKAPKSLASPPGSKALVVVVGAVADGLHEAAIEASALRRALNSAAANDVDWVARRELIERASVATQRLNHFVARSWNPADSAWTLMNDGKRVNALGGTSAALSEVADRIFTVTPRIANEMIAKRELSSQGAKARRVLIEALLEASDRERFGIEGYGPDRAMYEALFHKSGLHKTVGGDWVLSKPKDKRWAVVWDELNSALDSATGSRMNLVEVGNRLKAPPIGLKDGVLPILLVAALTARSEDIALYEHGSLVLSLDDAVAERLAKNPIHFAVKNAGASTGPRRVVIEAVAERLGLGAPGGSVTFLQVTRALYREVRSLPPYSQQTKKGLSHAALNLRSAFRNATEPDQLLFEAIPEALGLARVPVRGRLKPGAPKEFAENLAAALIELRELYPGLLAQTARQLSAASATYGAVEDVQVRLGGQAANLLGHVLDPRLSAFVGALSRTQIDSEDWLANVAMVVAEGHVPRVWSDDIAVRFELQVAELGGMLRRTSALLFDRRAEGGEAFDSRRVTVTKPDGSEQAYVLSMGESVRTSISADAAELMQRLAERHGSIDAARQTLLAWLVLSEDQSVATETREPSRVREGDL